MYQDVVDKTLHVHIYIYIYMVIYMYVHVRYCCCVFNLADPLDVRCNYWNRRQRCLLRSLRFILNFTHKVHESQRWCLDCTRIAPAEGALVTFSTCACNINFLHLCRLPWRYDSCIYSAVLHTVYHYVPWTSHESRALRHGVMYGKEAPMLQARKPFRLGAFMYIYVHILVSTCMIYQ